MKTKRNLAGFFRTLTLMALCLALLCSGALASTVRGDLSNRFEEPPTLEKDGQTYQYRHGLETILFMGIDTRLQYDDVRAGFRSGGQSDFLLLLVMFSSTFLIGQYPMEWMEAGVAWIGDLAGSALPEGPVRDLLVDGIIGGVGAVIVFLPQILILYFFISFMEDCGYMARAAFLMPSVPWACAAVWTPYMLAISTMASSSSTVSCWAPSVVPSDITPPVALAAYAGSAIAKVDPMKTGFNATKLAIAAFIVPYIFAFSPQMLFVDVTGAFQVVQICISALLGIFGVAAALNGFLYRPIPALLRVAMAVGGLGMMIPGTATDIAGFVLVVGIVLYQRFSARRAAMV